MSDKSEDVLINLVKFPSICAGLWPKPLTKNLFLSKIIFIYTAFARLGYGGLYVGIVVELLRLVTQRYSTQVILSSFSVVVNATKISIKVIIYLKHNVFQLYDDIMEREKRLWKENDPNIIKLYLTKIRTGKIFRMLLIGSTFATIMGLNLAGAYGMTQLIKYNQANNASLEPHYNYQFWFPVNKLEHLNCIYMINSFASVNGFWYNITTHMALITLLVYSSTHLAVLQYRLKHYIPENLEEGQMNEVIMTLKGFILEHQYLIKFIKKLNNKCTNIVMMEFVLSSFDAASVTLTLIKLELSEMLWLIAFLVLLIIQIFCLAWSCNEVNIESQAIADAVFESRWQLLNKNGKQLTQIMLQQAQQRPLQMTIGSFGPMTMQSFLTIWKIAYSYLSVMKK